MYVELELCAENGLMWEAEPPEVLEGWVEIKSYRDALAMVKMNMWFWYSTDSDRDPPRINSVATKFVKFVDDTANYPKRWQTYFKRTYGMYAPDRWAAPNAENLVEKKREVPWPLTNLASAYTLLPVLVPLLR